MKKTFIITLIFFFTWPSYGKANTSPIKRSNSNVEGQKELRDPFVRLIKRKRKGVAISKTKKTSFSNIPTMENTSIDRIKIVGILMGQERRAIAKIMKEDGSDASEDVFFLKENMELGENKAKIRAILPGGIVLVETILNVYDQEEYLETIIPVSQN